MVLQRIVVRIEQLPTRAIHLGQGPVKVLGKHLTTIRLHAAVSVEQEFEVVSENPIEPVAEEAEEATNTRSLAQMGIPEFLKRLARGSSAKL